MSLNSESVEEGMDFWGPRTSWVLPSLHRNSRRVLSDVSRAARYASGTIFRQGDQAHGLRRSISLAENQRLIASPESPDHLSSSDAGFSFLRMTKDEKITLLCLAVVDMFSYLCMSIMAPFFPAKVAEVFKDNQTGELEVEDSIDESGSQVVSGAVFSVYALTVFVASPIVAKLIPAVGAKFMFVAGIFIAGGCNFLFAFLDDMIDPTMFTTFAMVIRFLEGCGAAAFSTASFTILAYQFPGNVPVVFGTLEAFVGLGMTIGPAVGGLLHTAGGFKLPFFVVGSFMLATVPLNMWLLPTPTHEIVKPRKGSRKRFFRNPSIYIVSFTIVIMAAVWGFLDPTLQPHMTPYKLSSAMIGLVFLLLAAAYTIFSPFWGWIAEKMENSEILMIAGLLVTGVDLLFLGPSDFLNIGTQPLWLNLLCLTILGAGISMAMIPTFESLLCSSEDAGMEENIGTYAVVSGIFGSAYSLGEVVGPALGGYLDEYYGFGVCCTAMAGLCLGMGVIFSGYILFERAREYFKRERNAERSRKISLASWRTAPPRRLQIDSERRRRLGLIPGDYSSLSIQEPTSTPGYGTYSSLNQINDFIGSGIPVQDVEEDIPNVAISV